MKMKSACVVLPAALCLIMLCFFCGVSMADVVYTYTPNGETRGALGLIKMEMLDEVLSNDQPRTVLTALSGDLYVSSFWTNNFPHVVLIEHSEAGGTASGDRIRVFDPRGDWEPMDDKTLEGAFGTKSICVSDNGTTLFAASHESNTISAFYTVSYEKVHSYSHKAGLSGYASHAENVMIKDGAVYGLFSVVSSDQSTYRPSVLSLMDGQLDEKHLYSSFDVPAHAVEMVPFDSSRVAIAFLGASSREEGQGGVAFYERGTTTTIVSGDICGDVETLCSDGNGNLYFTGLTYEDGVPMVTLYRWNSTALTLASLDGPWVSRYSQVLWDGDNQLLIMLTEDSISVFNNNGSLLHKFTSGSLGGTPSSMALTVSSPQREKESSNGCDALSAGAPALGLLALGCTALKKIKK